MPRPIRIEYENAFYSEIAIEFGLGHTGSCFKANSWCEGELGE